MKTENIAEAAYLQIVNLWYAIMPEYQPRPSLLRKSSCLTCRSKAAIEGALYHLLEIVDYVHTHPWVLE